MIMKGAAHITGGGIPGNLNRVLPEGTSARVECSAWRVPALFKLIADRGEVPEAEMCRAVNMGVGLIVGVDRERVDEALTGAGFGGFVIGDMVPGDGTVRMEGRASW
jgi:phosphoribosylformylglycinamidine cyclo-ligase